MIRNVARALALTLALVPAAWTPARSAVPDRAAGFVIAPCWSPLGRTIRAGASVKGVLTGTVSRQRPHPRFDPARLPLLALFVATPIVVQGTVMSAARSPRSFGDDITYLDATVKVDAVVKNLSGVPLVPGRAIHAFFPSAMGGVELTPPLEVAPGQRSVWLLKSKSALVAVSTIVQSITADARGQLSGAPMQANYRASLDIASAHDVAGLCSLVTSATRSTPRTSEQLDTALMRWTGITTSAQQRVYRTQMRRDPDAVAVYLTIAKTDLGRGKDRTFPFSMCAASEPRARPSNTPASRSCMSLNAMLDRAEGPGVYIHP